jgi:hypothetical protein
MRVAARGPETLPGRDILSRREKDFHRLDLQKIFSNSPADFCLTLGDADVIRDSKSVVILSTPAARSEWAR